VLASSWSAGCGRGPVGTSCTGDPSPPRVRSHADAAPRPEQSTSPLGAPPVHGSGDNVGTSGARRPHVLCTSCGWTIFFRNFAETPCAACGNRRRTTPPQSETAGRPEATPAPRRTGRPDPRGARRGAPRDAEHDGGRAGGDSRTEQDRATGPARSPAPREAAEHDDEPPRGDLGRRAAGRPAARRARRRARQPRKGRQADGPPAVGAVGDRSGGAEDQLPAGHLGQHHAEHRAHRRATSDADAAGDRSGDGARRATRGAAPRRCTRPTGGRPPTAAQRATAATTGQGTQGEVRRRRQTAGPFGRPTAADRATGPASRPRRSHRRPPMRSADRLGRPSTGAQRGRPRDATRSDGRTAAQKVDLAVGATRPQADRMCNAGPLDLIHRGAPHRLRDGERRRVPVCQRVARLPASDTARRCEAHHAWAAGAHPAVRARRSPLNVAP
jgi:hypothetical protein